ncbi:MAG: DedD protein [Blastocatellia bacterium]|jgi:cell division protein FtsN|nr:DedD protein [Blastocatellia bacterium]
MRITCPECQFKGLIDTAPLAFETSVACVRCGTTFEAVLVDGEVRTSLPPATEENLPSQAIAPDFEPEMMEAGAEVEDALTLPPMPEAVYQPSEETPMLDAVLSVSRAEQAEPETALACQLEEQRAKQAIVLDELMTDSLDDVHSTESAETSDDEQAFKPPFAESAAEHERHNMGMRLMRISPLWLLICGVTFVSVIVLSNKFARPAEQEHQVATNFAASSNKATNQTAAQPPAIASNKATATSVQDVSPAPAPVEAVSETKAVEEKAETKAQPEPQPAPVIVPVADTKREAVYAPGPESEQAGGLTIQVGSYNVIEQANERVARLQSAGFSARVVTIELPKRGTWYRVQAGRFSNREEAARYGNEMKAKGAADSFIIADAGGR